MRLGKKLACATMMFTIFAGTVFNTHADTELDQKEFAKEFLENYTDVLLTHDVNNVQDMLTQNDDTEFFLDFLEWRVKLMDELDAEYSAYSYDIIDVNVIDSNPYKLEVIYNEDFSYANGAGDGLAYGNKMYLEINEQDEDYCINNVYWTSDDLYDAYCEKRSALPQLYTSNETDINAVLIDELSSLHDEMQEVYQYQKYNGSNREEVLEPLAAGYSYSAIRGAAYARKYVTSHNPYFYYVNNNNCTNFVSQCIWAAYGGWSSTMTDTTIQNNISNRVRMTSSWYAGSGGGADNWEQVGKLWNYVVGNSGSGPKAIGYNNGGYYTGILPIDISVGDVLQRGVSSSDYRHSVYVISVPGGSDPTYSEILIAQNSNDAIRTVSELIASGCYLRQMRFQTGTFDK